jgi:WD40 repeat protein
MHHLDAAIKVRTVLHQSFGKMSWWPANENNENVKYSSTMTAFQKPVSLQLLSDDAPKTPPKGTHPHRAIMAPGAPSKPRKPSKSSVYFTRIPSNLGEDRGMEFITQDHQWRSFPTSWSPWGSNESLEARFMGISSAQQSPELTTSKDIRQHCSPSRNIGRPPLPVRASTGGQVSDVSPPTITATTAVIERSFTIETPEVLMDDNLSVLSYGPSLAVAMYDQLFLYNQDGRGSPELFTCTEDGSPISCVKWQNKASLPKQGQAPLIALGLEDAVEIWTVEYEGDVVRQFTDHSGFVTAFCWKGDDSELLAASKTGIKRHPIVSKKEQVFQYQHGHGSSRITCLRWSDKDDIFASAGNNIIQVWDATERGENIQPLWTLHHTGVRCVEFSASPDQKMLVSGGEHGLMFWNLQNGTLRSSIPLGHGDVVTGIVWSHPNELLASHINSLTLLDPSKGIKLAHTKTTDGTILSMAQGPSGHIACIHDEEVVSGYTVTGSESKNIDHDGHSVEESNPDRAAQIQQVPLRFSC